MQPIDVVGTEDCLVLNVYSPKVSRYNKNFKEFNSIRSSFPTL